MTYPYEINIKATPITGDSVDPSGIVFDTIELQSRLFGNWAPASVPEHTIRDELARVIADELIIDVEWSKDPRSGYATGKFSSVVYMKPDMQQLRKDNQNLQIQILEGNSKRLEMEKSTKKIVDELHDTVDSVLNWQNKYYNLQRENSKLQVQMNCKFNDYRFLLKQGFKMLTISIKCEMYALTRFIPFRG